MASISPESLRQRKIPSDLEEDEKTAWTDESGLEEDETLPYKGKVYLARRKKPDTLITRILEVLAVVSTAYFIYYSYHYMDDLHYRSTHLFAMMGQPHSMHMIGQRYLFGKGVTRDVNSAMEWFSYAAKKGHPHAAHNLAVGHLHGYETSVKDKEEAKNLLRFAAGEGVPEAHDALTKLCSRDGC